MRRAGRFTNPGHHPPQLPSRLPSTHTPWSGRGSGRQGGAPHWTNDLDALGRDCSALPGATADGMGAPRPRHTRPAPANGAPPSRSLSAPAGGMIGPLPRFCGAPSWPRPYPHLARVGAARAERAEGRSGARGGAGSAPGGAERSQLDGVEKVLPRCCPWGLSCLG